jgi:hypothetical protein
MQEKKWLSRVLISDSSFAWKIRQLTAGEHFHKLPALSIDGRTAPLKQEKKIA